MSGANHLTGGVVFTSIFCSFWNVNVFSSPALLFFTAFISILPDIDHLRSPIGKLFYPIAKFLDRRYGHRTITHSFICYLALFFIVAFIERTFSEGFNYTLAFCFAYFSHLLFDMMTKQGVPLLYPFKRNPCVIPGNPDLRLKSSDLKTESICFAIFLMLGITCQPLFANGFWSSYNRSFATLKHVNNEYRQSEKLVHLYFKISRQGNIIEDSGYVVKSSETECIVFSNNKFTVLNNEDKIINLVPFRSKVAYTTNDIFFSNVDADSLASIIKNKPILNLKLQASGKMNYTKEHKPITSNSADLEYIYNPTFNFISDSLSKDIRNRIEILNYELRSIEQEKNKRITAKQALKDSITFIINSFEKFDNYEREKATSQLAKLQGKQENLKIESEDNSGKIAIQIRHLNEELKGLQIASASGYIQFINLK